MPREWAWSKSGSPDQKTRAGFDGNTDVCLCEYTSHGPLRVVIRLDGEHFHVLNDESVELIAKTAVSHAAAGADHGRAKRHDGWPDRPQSGQRSTRQVSIRPGS